MEIMKNSDKEEILKAIRNFCLKLNKVEDRISNIEKLIGIIDSNLTKIDKTLEEINE